MSGIERILDSARQGGADQAEVFFVQSEETPVKFETNRLKEINSRHTSGAALRVIAGGRIGFASSTKPGDVEGLVQAAMETAPFGPEAHFDFPATAEAPAVDLYDEEIAMRAVDEMIDHGQTLIDGARRHEPELLCEAHVRRSVANVAIANSNGGVFTYEGTTYSAFVYGTRIRGTDMLFVGDGAASCKNDLDLGAIEREVAQQLDHTKVNASVRTGEMPVIFTSNGVAGALVGPLVMAFSGRNVVQGQSPLVDSLGERKYDERLSAYDDGTLAYRPGSRPVDDEGMPSRRTALVEKGVVSSFLYDLQTAGIAKVESTASASRSLTTQPTVSTSCLTIDEGDMPFEEMVRGVKAGLVVEELIGAGQGNVMGGDFSGNVLLGYKIEGGEIVGRVKDTIVAGNLHEALARVEAIGKERRWVGGSLLVPALMFGRLTVSAGS
jgi:PmbA protein